MSDVATKQNEAKLLLAGRLTAVPEGNFDSTHLADIHRHLFAGLLSSAGRFREGNKDFAGHDAVAADQLPKRLGQFCGKLAKMNFLQGQTRGQAVATLADTYAGLLRLAPFDKGMELSALVFTRGLAIKGGLDFDCRALAGKQLEFAASQYLAGNKDLLHDAFNQAMGQAEWTKNYDRRASQSAQVSPVLSEQHGAMPNDALRKKNRLFESRIRRGLESLGLDVPEMELKKVMSTLAPEVDTLLPYPGKLEERLRFEMREHLDVKPVDNKYENGIDFNVG